MTTMQPVASVSSMKITDLGADCLQSCFRHLGIEELLNVADSNKELRLVARDVFHRMHRQKRVRFHQALPFLSDDDIVNQRLSLFTNELYIRDLKLSLQFLRCFGDLISVIKFNFCTKHIPLPECFTSGYQPHLYHIMKCDQKWGHLITGYMNDVCTESLRQIEFIKENCSCDLSKLTKPFVKVETLKGNIFFQSSTKLHELFPNIREIEMVCPHSSLFDPNTDFMTNRFSYLEHLHIDIYHENGYSKENFAIALRLNPQIKTLTGNIWFDVLFDVNDIRCWNEHLQNLEKIKFAVGPPLNNNLIEMLKKPTPISDDLHFKNLKELSIALNPKDIFDVDTTLTFPFTGDKLESLILFAPRSQLQQFSIIFNKHPTVKKLKIDYNRYNRHTVFKMNIDDCSIISKAFPLLEEIFFENILDDTVGAIKMFPSLKYFRIETVDDTDRVIRSLDGWSILSVSKAISYYSDGIAQRTIEGKRNNS